jgi:hypothetical protein
MAIGPSVNWYIDSIYFSIYKVNKKIYIKPIASNGAPRVVGIGKPGRDRRETPVGITRAHRSEEVTMVPKYPHITVQLTNEDGNAFAVLGRVNRALRQAGVSQAERDAFLQEATAGDYDRLLQTVMRWVEVA